MNGNTMEPQWVKLEERRPVENGLYIVIWANPYTMDKLHPKTEYFRWGRFENETSGANYIAYWLDGLELPHMSMSERNKGAKRY